MNDGLATGPVLEARNIDFFHGPQHVLRDVSLTMRPGRHYIIAGPNGAGKSTLMDILASLKIPARGAVSLDGRPLRDYGAVELARLVAFAPQEARFNFPFTIREVVAMGRRPYLGRWGRLNDDDHAAVTGAIASLHLDAIADKPVTALSGGERRRTVVARALAQDTPVLLLDEPSAGLDIAQALSLMALARRLAEAGRLVVTVSHDLSLAAVYGHDMVFLKAGVVCAAGPVAAVFTEPVLEDIYETPARVRMDEFAGGLAASFSCPE
ncbi:MAG: ABC transporter ATP-binding protein [Planctomycetes bacterium]|nr:ABC transporter ATP-binding protein [Planctomycetota bacterium]